MRSFRGASKYQIVPLTLAQDNVAANQTTVQMKILEVAGAVNNVTGWVLPYSGWVVGISARTSSARTGGTLTADATVNGTATGLQAVIDGTNTQSHYASQQITADDVFSIGDLIGCELTTTAAWAPAADLAVAVWILIDTSESTA